MLITFELILILIIILSFVFIILILISCLKSNCNVLCCNRFNCKILTKEDKNKLKKNLPVIKNRWQDIRINFNDEQKIEVVNTEPVEDETFNETIGNIVNAEAIRNVGNIILDNNVPIINPL